MSGEEKKTILLVEDDPITCESVSTVLRKSGYEVVTAESGEETVSLIADNLVDVHLILMDMELGEGMDGTETARMVLSVRNIPIVFHTSLVDRSVIERVRGITRYGYVDKASGYFILLSAIEMAFELYNARQLVESKMEALRESEAEYRALSEASPLGIFQADLFGNWVYTNTVLQKMLSLSFPETLGQNWRQSIHPDDLEAVSREWKSAVMQSRMSSLDFRLQTQNGETLWIHGLVAPVIDSKGQAHGFVGTMENVTEMKLTLEQLKKAREESDRANQAKSQFLANVSHEIRTPMNSILAHTRLAQKEEANPKVSDYLNTIHGSSVILLQLLNDILDLSKIESGKLELEQIPFPIADIPKQIFGMFSAVARERGIQFSYALSSDIPDFLLGDPLRLQQILLNLVGNAMKFTNDGSVGIHIELDGIVDRIAQIRIEIRDTGVGIPIEQQSRLFSLFSQADSSTTRKYGGTGLGLAICKRLVALMGGTISQQSGAGKGSTFTVRLPLEIQSGFARNGRHREAVGRSDQTGGSAAGDMAGVTGSQDGLPAEADEALNPTCIAPLVQALGNFSELIRKHDLAARNDQAQIRELLGNSGLRKPFAQVEACLKRLDFKKASVLVGEMLSEIQISAQKEDV